MRGAAKRAPACHAAPRADRGGKRGVAAYHVAYLWTQGGMTMTEGDEYREYRAGASSAQATGGTRATGRGSRTSGWQDAAPTPRPVPTPITGVDTGASKAVSAARSAPPAPPRARGATTVTGGRPAAAAGSEDPTARRATSVGAAGTAAKSRSVGRSNAWKDPAASTSLEPSGPGAMERYDAAVKEYKEVNADYQDRVKKAEAAVERARKEHDDAVEAARRLIKQENDEYAKPVDKFAKATLYQDRVVYGKAGLELEPGGVTARIVDVKSALHGAGSWSTAAVRQSTRLIEEARESGEDRRFVEVRTGRDAILIPFADKDEQNARFFASRVVTTAENLESARRNHEERLANFADNVQRVSDDTGTIEAAERTRDEIKGDTHALESARTAVDFARAAVPTLELEEREQRDKKRRLIIGVAIGLVIALIAAVLIILLT